MPEAVLVVENDPRVRDVVVALVENEGHKAVPAVDGDEALRLLREGLQPCLILWVRDGDTRVGQGVATQIATIPMMAVSGPSKLDSLSRVLKRHCINNHRFA